MPVERSQSPDERLGSGASRRHSVRVHSLFAFVYIVQRRAIRRLKVWFWDSGHRRSALRWMFSLVHTHRGAILRTHSPGATVQRTTTVVHFFVLLFVLGSFVLWPRSSVFCGPSLLVHR